MRYFDKTPLTIISGCAENLRENVDPEKREFYENAIIENAKYTESIINDALQLTRSEKDIARPERSRFEISPIVSELWKKYEFSASERGLTLSVSGDAKIKADRKMITQLLENLISNAVKYADPETAIRFSSNLIAVSNEFSGKITTDKYLSSYGISPIYIINLSGDNLYNCLIFISLFN